jgi:F420-0:gamma-glutamyl ligase
MNQPEQDPAGDAWRALPPRVAAGRRFLRYAVRTHVIRPGDPLARTLTPYLAGVRRGDVVAIGEKAVAIAEGRLVELAAVEPRALARWLARHVRSLGYGMGLRRPETMEMAFREGGTCRVLGAAAVAAAGRLIGRSGDFYRIAGPRVAAIDGPGPTTLPPYDRAIVLAPQNPRETAARLARRFGVAVAIVDANDLGCEVLGSSAGVDALIVAELLRDNPMGQGRQQTPVVVLRPAGRFSPPPSWPPARIPPPEHGAAVVPAGGPPPDWSSEAAAEGPLVGRTAGYNGVGR